MNPPPPMFPAAGYVTASANAVATAASTALPPDLSPETPPADAAGQTETTTPLAKAVGASRARAPEVGTRPTTAARQVSNGNARRIIGNSGMGESCEGGRDCRGK